MDAAKFIARFPSVWHMAESETWTQIERHGLLSTSAILDLYRVQGVRRYELERQRRLDSARLSNDQIGTMVIRDQKPLNESWLEKCLVGMTREEWYLTLNQRVFFWVRFARVKKLLCARAYRGRTHTVLTVDTKALLGAHADRVELSMINTGAIHPGNMARRGTGTFRSLKDFPTEDLSKVVEMTIKYSVPDLAQHTTKGELMKCQANGEA